MLQITPDELKQIQLDLLDVVDTFCREKGLTYYLFVGTLLGAVRHKGYIPWDDDIDICMVREDYDRFFKEFNLSNDHHVKAICHETSNNYYLASGKVIDTRTVLKEKIDAKLSIGVFIDIFPMDRLPDDQIVIKDFNRKLNVYRKLLLIKNITPSTDRKWYKNFALISAKIPLSLLSRSFVLDRIDNLAQKYRDVDNCTRIGDLAVFTYDLKELFFANDFENTVELEFERKKYLAPAGYDNILSQLFGDYLKLPPIEKRVPHHAYEAYWKES